MALPRLGSRVVEFFSQVGGRSPPVRVPAVPQSSRRSRSTDAGRGGSPPRRDNFLIGKSSEPMLDRLSVTSGFTDCVSKRVFFTGVEESKEFETEKEENFSPDLNTFWSDSERRLCSRENSCSKLSVTVNNSTEGKLSGSEDVIYTEAEVKKKEPRNEFNTLTKEFSVSGDTATGQLTEARFGLIGNGNKCEGVVGESWYRDKQAVNVLFRDGKCDEGEVKIVQQDLEGNVDTEIEKYTLIDDKQGANRGAPLCIGDNSDLTSPWNLQSDIPFFSTDHEKLKVATELTLKLDSFTPPLQTSLSDFSLLMDSKFDSLEERSSQSQTKIQKSYTTQTVHMTLKQRTFVAPSGPSLKGGLPFSILLNQHHTTRHKLPSPGNIQKRVYTNDKRRLSAHSTNTETSLGEIVNSENVLESADCEEQSKISQCDNGHSPKTSA